MNNFYVYAYTRKDGTPYYIGKGKDDRAYDGSSHNIKPPTNKSQIVFLNQNLPEDKAFEAERLYIAMFGRKDLGTGILRNLTNGGEGPSGHRHSVETREKQSWSHKNRQFSESHKAHISAAKKGKSRSKETINKMSIALKGRISPMKGKHHSKETCEKISKAKTGRCCGENHPMYGRHHTSESKAKMREAKIGKYCGENHPMFGKRHSEESKAKMSISAKNRRNLACLYL
ncbi:MAG: hypothetical protein KGI27_13470 [Thaumarchaeota archaeon]|nr:hypothetical protein [Nitrososphaerota archaeon]